MAYGHAGDGPAAVDTAMSNQLFERPGTKPPPPPRPLASPTTSDQTPIQRQQIGPFPRQYNHELCMTDGWGIPSNQSYSNGTLSNAPQVQSQPALVEAGQPPVQNQASQQQQQQQQQQQTHPRPPPPRYLPHRVLHVHAPVVHGPSIASIAVPAALQPPPPPLSRPIVVVHSSVQPLSVNSGTGPGPYTGSSRQGASSMASQHNLPTPQLSSPVSAAPQQRPASEETTRPGSAGVAHTVQRNAPPPPPPRFAVATQSAVQPLQVSGASPAPPPSRLLAGAANRGAANRGAATAAESAGGGQMWMRPPPPAAAAARPPATPARAGRVSSSHQIASTAAAAAPPPPARPSATATAAAAAAAAAQTAPIEVDGEEDVYSGSLAPWMLWYQQGLQRAVQELVLDPQARHQLTGLVRRYGYGEWLLRQVAQQVGDLKQRILQAVTAGSTAGGNDTVDSILEFEDLISRAQAEGPPAAPPQLPGRPGYARTSNSSSTGATQQQQTQQPYQPQVMPSAAGSNSRSNDVSGSSNVSAGDAGPAHRVGAGGSSSSRSTANGRIGLVQEAAAGAVGRSVLDDAADTRQQLACIICLDAPRSVLLLPCKHLVLCDKCATELQEKAAASRDWRSVVRAQPMCPVCREVVQSHIQGVFL